MGIDWFITAQIKISESAYSAWLASDVHFNFEVTFINPIEAEPDPIIGAITGFAKDKTKSSVARLFANELLSQTQNSPTSAFYFRYDKERKYLDFHINLKTISDFQISRILAAFLSIVEYKNLPGCDTCIVSKSNFKNVRYINEVYRKNVIIMPKVTNDYYIPENLAKIYDLATGSKLSQHEKVALIEPDIIAEFKDIISRELAPGIDEILKKSSEAEPSFITENSLFKTDGINVLSKDGSIVKEADPHSFKSLGGYYAVDANGVYYNSTKLEGADPDTFAVLHWDYAKDKNNAYFMAEKIAELNGGNFKALRPAYGYAATDYTVFYCGEPIEASDPSSFHAVGEGKQNDSLYFGADNNHVYLDGKIVKGIDPLSFTHIGKHFFKDTKHVYADATVIEGCTPESVRVLNNYYIADNEDAYFVFEGTAFPLHSKDVKNLKVNDFIAADFDNVYYKGVKIEGADGATADIFDKNNDGYITDKSSVFYCDKKLPALPSSFTSMGFGYATDGENVFFRDTLIKGADAETFVPTSYGSAGDKFAKYSFARPITKNLRKDFQNIAGDYFKDGKNIYYKNVVLPGADYESFSHLDGEHESLDISDILASEDERLESAKNSEYAKDVKNVYYTGLVVQGADPYSFEILHHQATSSSDKTEYNAYSKDANHVYYLGKEIVALSPFEFNPHEIENVWMAGERLYFKGKPVNYIDFNTFTPLEYGYYKDSLCLYYGIEKIDGILPDSAILISPNYVKDDIFFCYVEKTKNGELIKNLFEADGNSFDLIDFNVAFAYDRFGLYFKGKSIKGVDITSISYLDDNYLKDAQNIFCGNVKLQDVDVNKFEPLGSGYASDGITFFFQWIRLKSDKPIHVLGSGYATNGQTFWLDGQEIQNPQDDVFLRETLGMIL